MTQTLRQQPPPSRHLRPASQQPPLRRKEGKRVGAATALGRSEEERPTSRLHNQLCKNQAQSWRPPSPPPHLVIWLRFLRCRRRRGGRSLTRAEQGGSGVKSRLSRETRDLQGPPPPTPPRGSWRRPSEEKQTNKQTPFRFKQRCDSF